MEAQLSLGYNETVPEPIGLGQALADAIAAGPGWSGNRSAWSGSGPGYFSILVLWRHDNTFGVASEDAGALQVDGHGPGERGSAALEGTFFAPIVDVAHLPNAEASARLYARGQVDTLEALLAGALESVVEQNFTVAVDSTGCYPPPP